MVENRKISDIITEIGKKIYGNQFSIENEKLKECYKAAYETIVKDKKKGVFLVGGVGIGKSAMMKTLQVLLKDTERRFKWANSYELKDLSEQMTIGEIKANYCDLLNSDLYIDDIGFTVDVKRYGNTVNIISEIITERYDLFVSSGVKTHFSTNLLITSKDPNVPTIEKFYGVRIVDRLKEMCNLITWNGESLRK